MLNINTNTHTLETVVDSVYDLYQGARNSVVDPLYLKKWLKRGLWSSWWLEKQSSIPAFLIFQFQNILPELSCIFGLVFES